MNHEPLEPLVEEPLDAPVTGRHTLQQLMHNGDTAMTPGQLAETLEEMAAAVRAADPFDGDVGIGPWHRDPRDQVIQGTYRIGDPEGGGWMWVILEMRLAHFSAAAFNPRTRSITTFTSDGRMAGQILDSDTVEPGVETFDLPAWLRERIAADERLEPLGDVVTELEQIAERSGDPDARDHAEAALGRMALIWVSVEELERLMGWAG